MLRTAGQPKYTRKEEVAPAMPRDFTSTGKVREAKRRRRDCLSVLQGLHSRFQRHAVQAIQLIALAIFAMGKRDGAEEVSLIGQLL